MDNIDLERAAYVFEGDPLLPIFRHIADEFPNQRMTAAQILEKIQEIHEDTDLTATGIGKLLKAKEEPLNKLFGFEMTYNRRTKRRLYRFGRDSAVEAEPQTALDEFIQPTLVSEEAVEEEEEVPIGYQELPMIEGFLQWMRDKTDESSEPIPIIVARLWLLNHYGESTEQAQEIIDRLINDGTLFAPTTTTISIIR
jgi:hypothetical protein